MAQGRIEAVSATKLRGASRTTTLKFDPSKRFVLVFGENGTGKSTMIDAIDMVCNQTAGTLQDRSSVTVSKHLPTIGAKAGDLSAQVTSSGQTWTATLKGSKITTAPDLDTPNVAILRRHKVLKLVEATPSERFNELKRFIDVAGVQRSEDALPKAIKACTQRIDAKTRDVDQADERLKQAFTEHHTPEEAQLSPRQWAKRRSDGDVKTLSASVVTLKNLIDTHGAASTLLEAKNTSKTNLDDMRNARKAVLEKIKAAGDVDTETGIVLVDLLAKAGDYLGKAEGTQECPVCLQPVSGADLASEIQERLGKMTELTSLAKALSKADEDVKAATNHTQQSYMGLIGKVFSLAKLVDALDVEHRGAWTFNKPQFTHLFEWADELTKEVIAESDALMDAVAALMEHIKSRHETLSKQATLLNGIKQSYATCVAMEKEVKREFAVRGVLEKMLEVVRRERLAFINGILDGIADECDGLYSKIHPGEKLGSVRFAMDQEKKGSLNQSGQFEGHKDIAPQAYFSDSHLDTLAFCFFLAVTKQTMGANTVIVIDDVFTSVDMGHIKRILNVLLEGTEDLDQVILATHQRRWLDLFMTQQAPMNEACIIQLREWSLATGICGDDVKPYLEDLQASLAAPKLNRRDVSSLSGFLIESVLGEMTKHLNCSIKRNPRDKYTAHDLLSSMTKAAKTIKVYAAPAKGVDPVLISDGPPSLQELVTDLRTTLDDVRNAVGDHFNWDAADISDETVRTFGGNVEAMCRMLLCGVCGGMATREKRTHLACSCSHLRIARG